MFKFDSGTYMLHPPVLSYLQRSELGFNYNADGYEFTDTPLRNDNSCCEFGPRKVIKENKEPQFAGYRNTRNFGLKDYYVGELMVGWDRTVLKVKDIEYGYYIEDYNYVTKTDRKPSYRLANRIELLLGYPLSRKSIKYFIGTRALSCNRQEWKAAKYLDYYIDGKVYIESLENILKCKDELELDALLEHPKTEQHSCKYSLKVGWLDAETIPEFELWLVGSDFNLTGEAVAGLWEQLRVDGSEFANYTPVELRNALVRLTKFNQGGVVVLVSVGDYAGYMHTNEFLNTRTKDLYPRPINHWPDRRGGSFGWLLTWSKEIYRYTPDGELIRNTR